MQRYAITVAVVRGWLDSADGRVLSRLVLLVLAVYLLTMAGRLTSGDGETVYQTTRSLITRGQLRVPPRPETAIGRGGASYSKYGLGQSIAQAPFFVVGEVARLAAGAGDDRLTRFVIGMTNSVVTVALVCVFWIFCRQLGCGRRSATAAALILALSTPMWPYARADFAEPLQATALLGVFFAFFHWRHAPRGRWAFAGGSLAGFAFLTKAASLVVLAPLGLYFAVALVSQARVRGAAFAATHAGLAAFPLGASIGFQAALNYHRFGSVSEFGYGAEPAVGFTTPLLTGISYLLFSTGKGLVFFAPPVVLGFALLPALARRFRLEALVIALVFLIQLLYFSRWWAWHGDWSWGPRYLVLTVPFLMLGWAPLLAHWRSWPIAMRGVAGALAACGAAVSFLGVAIDYGGYYSIVGSQIGRGVDVKEARLVPQFSPILGHAWLARASLHDTIAALRSGGAPRDTRHNPVLSTHPWAVSHPELAPEAPERALGFDFWFTALKGRTRFVEYWSMLIAGWLALALLPRSASLARALRVPAPEREIESKPAPLHRTQVVPAWQR